MKALTLTQPWATLVAIGAKKIETRSWHTDYRGLVAIHAAKAMPREAVALCSERPFLDVLDDHGLVPSRLPRGAVLAIVELTGCFPTRDGSIVEDLEPNEISFGDYSFGRWGWRLKLKQAFDEPIPAKGMLGLWEWEPNERTRDNEQAWDVPR